MTYKCDDCGNEFETLSSKRMHDCSAGDPGDCPVCGSDLIEMQSGFESEVMKCIDCGHLLEWEFFVPEHERDDRPASTAPECSYCGSSSTEFALYTQTKQVVSCDQCGLTFKSSGYE